MDDSHGLAFGNQRDPVGTCFVTTFSTVREFSPCRTSEFAFSLIIKKKKIVYYLFFRPILTAIDEDEETRKRGNILSCRRLAILSLDQIVHFSSSQHQTEISRMT